MSWIVYSHIATLHKLRDSWTVSTIPNVETFPATEWIPKKVREAFSKWTRFIGWEEVCESRPEAKVPHLFYHWQVRTLTKYKNNWVLHTCPWRTLSPEHSIPNPSATLPWYLIASGIDECLGVPEGAQVLQEWLHCPALLPSSCVAQVHSLSLPLAVKWGRGALWCPTQLWLSVQKTETPVLSARPSSATLLTGCDLSVGKSIAPARNQVSLWTLKSIQNVNSPLDCELAEGRGCVVCPVSAVHVLQQTLNACYGRNETSSLFQVFSRVSVAACPWMSSRWQTQLSFGQESETGWAMPWRGMFYWKSSFIQCTRNPQKAARLLEMPARQDESLFFSRGIMGVVCHHPSPISIFWTGEMAPQRWGKWGRS